MSRPKFQSAFSEEMNHYLDDMVASGYKENRNHLRQFD